MKGCVRTKKLSPTLVRKLYGKIEELTLFKKCKVTHVITKCFFHNLILYVECIRMKIILNWLMSQNNLCHENTYNLPLKQGRKLHTN